jgi:hypothetical protein
MYEERITEFMMDVKNLGFVYKPNVMGDLAFEKFNCYNCLESNMTLNKHTDSIDFGALISFNGRKCACSINQTYYDIIDAIDSLQFTTEEYLEGVYSYLVRSMMNDILQGRV